MAEPLPTARASGAGPTQILLILKTINFKAYLQNSKSITILIPNSNFINLSIKDQVLISKHK